MNMDEIIISSDPLDVGSITDRAISPSIGSTSLFVGTTRNNFQGKRVLHLELEAYEPMARKEIIKICADIRSKWSLQNIIIHHRLGLIEVNEANVVIAISSHHRKDSLEAVQYAINRLKETVPIWKKEKYESGEEWKANRECKWKEGNGIMLERLDDSDVDVNKKLNARSFISIDKTLIQVAVSKEVLDQRIERFCNRKREEIDKSNLLEFCNIDKAEFVGDSCARIVANPTLKGESKSHIRTSQVLNTEGPMSTIRTCCGEDVLEVVNNRSKEENEALGLGGNDIKNFSQRLKGSVRWCSPIDKTIRKAEIRKNLTTLD